MAKEILIKNDRHSLVVSNRLSVKSLLKHFVVLAYLVLATLTLFRIDINNLSDLIDTPVMAIEMFAVYFLMYHLLKTTLRMINMSNQTIYFSIAMSALMIGYSVFIYLWFDNGFISELSDLWKVMWYYLPALGLILVWKIAQIFFERKANPVLTKALIISAISTASWIGFLVFSYFMSSWYLIDHTKEFYVHGDRSVGTWTVVYLVLYALVGLIYLVSSSYAFAFMYKHDMKSVLKMSINYAGAIVLLVPFIIWFIYFSYNQYLEKDNWITYLYIGLYALLIVASFIVAFTWKNALGSPMMITIAFMSILSLAWAGGMMTTIFDPYGDHINYLLSKVCPLLVSVTVICLIYFKNLQVPFVETLAWVFIIAAMAYWLMDVANFKEMYKEVMIHKTPTGTLPPEYQDPAQIIWWILLLVDGLAAVVPALILTVSITRWFRIQKSIRSKTAKVKHLKQKKVKVSKNIDSTKEAPHA